MENSRIAVPVIYRGIVTSLSKLSEVKQHFIRSVRLQVRNAHRAQQGACLCLTWEDLMGGRLDHPEASSQHVWHLDEVAVTIDRWSPYSLPYGLGFSEHKRLSFQKEHSQRVAKRGKCPKA